jgi:hypothetical protein
VVGNVQMEMYRIVLANNIMINLSFLESNQNQGLIWKFLNLRDMGYKRTTLQKELIQKIGYVKHLPDWQEISK